MLCAVFAALFTCNIPVLGIISFTIILTATITLAVIYRKRPDRLLTFIIAAILCASAFTGFLVTKANWIEEEIDYSKPVSVIGTVEADVEIDGTRRIYLKGVSLNGENVNGRLLIYATASGEKFSAGSVVTFAGKVKPNNLVEKYDVYGSAYRDNLHYISSVTSYDINVIGHNNPALFIKIRAFIYGKLVAGLGEHYGALSYGMITGDKAYLDRQTKNYFSAAGLVHILAVSGMHLGMLTTILMLILKKLKVRRVVTTLVVITFLFLYAFIAGFSPSVMRAAIMSFVGMLVFLFGARRDMLSSLCLAFCLIVAFAPILMFEVGFAISFGCVFGITLFASPIEKALKKIKIPKSIAGALSLSISVQLGLIPAAIFFFNNFQPYALIINLLLLPIIMIIFIVLIACLILCCIISPLSVVFKVPLLGLTAIDFFAQKLSMLPYVRVVVYALPAIFMIYALYFLCSRFVMVRHKWIYLAASVILCASMIFVQNPTLIDKTSLANMDVGSSGVTYLTDGKEGYLIGDIWSGYLTLNNLKAMKVRKLTAVFVNKMDYDVAIQMQIIGLLFSGFTVYYPADADFYKLAAEKREIIADNLKNIKTVGFDCRQSGEGDSEGTLVVALAGGFDGVFNSGIFCGFAFKKDGLDAKVSILFPKANYRYSRLDIIDDYNVIRAYRYYDVGEKLYLIGETLDEDTIKGKNIYTNENGKNIYNYANFRFY